MWYNVPIGCSFYVSRFWGHIFYMLHFVLEYICYIESFPMCCSGDRNSIWILFSQKKRSMNIVLQSTYACMLLCFRFSAWGLVSKSRSISYQLANSQCMSSIKALQAMMGHVTWSEALCCINRVKRKSGDLHETPGNNRVFFQKWPDKK